MEDKEKPFEITHSGLYKTRDGRKAFVSYIKPDKKKIFPVVGIIEGKTVPTLWSVNGSWNVCLENENENDIVSKWED